jgi:hypothetical protein
VPTGAGDDRPWTASFCSQKDRRRAREYQSRRGQEAAVRKRLGLLGTRRRRSRFATVEVGRKKDAGEAKDSFRPVDGGPTLLDTMAPRRSDMPRPTTKTDETTSAQPSLQDKPRALIDQQGELGQRIIVLAMRAETEIEDLKIQVQTCAAELGEARVELAGLRAAHEIEMQKRATAEARVDKLKAKIATIRAECDHLDEEDAAGPVIEATADTGLGRAAPGMDPVVEGLGLTETDLALLDMLVRRGAAPDRKEMLRSLVRRGLAAGRLPACGVAPSDLDLSVGTQATRS